TPVKWRIRDRAETTVIDWHARLACKLRPVEFSDCAQLVSGRALGEERGQRVELGMMAGDTPSVGRGRHDKQSLLGMSRTENQKMLVNLQKHRRAPSVTAAVTGRSCSRCILRRGSAASGLLQQSCLYRSGGVRVAWRWRRSAWAG